MAFDLNLFLFMKLNLLGKSLEDDQRSAGIIKRRPVENQSIALYFGFQSYGISTKFILRLFLIILHIPSSHLYFVYIEII